MQRETDDEPLWEVFCTPDDLRGDNVAVSGASATFKSIAVGASYEDRGMRLDSHDVVAVVLTLPDAAQPGLGSKRNCSFGESGSEPGVRSKQKCSIGELSGSDYVESEGSGFRRSMEPDWSRSSSPAQTERPIADGEDETTQPSDKRAKKS